MNEKLLKKIQHANIISFDIFDTLVQRYVERPIDVFSLVERKYNNEVSSLANLSGYKKIRCMAEKKARKKKGNREVSLEDIFEEMSYPNEMKMKLMNFEREIEKVVCFPNSEMVRVFNYCLSIDKTVIITSDMYLDEITIIDILEKVGIKGYHRLFLSSSVGYKKSSGKLYEFLLSELSISKDVILHIGDNEKSDIQVPALMGIDTWKVNKSINKHNIYQRKDYKSNVVNGFLSKYNYQNVYSQIGTEVLGPLLYGFCKWLGEEIKKEQPDRIFFMARDGYIMLQAFKELFPNIPVDYVYASRRALIVPILWKNCEIENIQNIIHFHSRMKLTEFLERVGINFEDCNEVLKKYGYTKDTCINGEKLFENVVFRKFYNDIKDDIIENSKREYYVAKTYWDKQIGTAKKIFLIDIGWNGNMQNALINLIDNKDITVAGYYLGANPNTRYRFPMVGYMYDRYHDQELKKIVENFSSLLETLFMADHGSLLKYLDSEPYVCLYSNEYRDNYGKLINEVNAISQIQDGAIRFIKMFDLFYSKLGIPYKIDDAIANLIDLGMHPSIETVVAMGDFRFFNSEVSYLAHPKEGKFNMQDFMNTNWRIGYLKRCFKINIRYDYIALIIKKCKKFIVH